MPNLVNIPLFIGYSVGIGYYDWDWVKLATMPTYALSLTLRYPCCMHVVAVHIRN